MITRANKGVIL